MGQVLHGFATTTHAVRAAIPRSKASIQALYGLNPKTVAKWRKRASLEDQPMGPKALHSTVLSADEETLIVAFRRHTLLPLDDCLYALQATVPHLTRSALHRLFQRHANSCLPTAEGTRPRRKFKAYPLGYIHIDFAEVWTEEGKLYLFVAVDRVSKFAFAELHEPATRRIAADFLRRLLEHVPYRVHTVLTDNGFQFTEPRGGWSVREIQGMLAAGQPFRAHAFNFACAQHGIDHRLMKFNHPWTNGQVERMNRTSRMRPSVGSSTRPMRAFARTWPPSSMRTTLRSASRVSAASPLLNGFVSSGQSSPNDSDQSPPPHGGTEHLAGC